MTTFRAVDLCSGIGGIRLAFQQAFGDDIVFVKSVEKDKSARKIYMANFREDPIGDITKMDPSSFPNHDIVMAGFPCQPFSQSGHRDGFDDPRGNLFFHLASIIKEKRPSCIFLENVANLEKHDGGKTFATIRKVLVRELGYFIYYKVMNSLDFGVPQTRPRIYIVAFKKRLKFKFPKPNGIKTTIGSILEEKVAEHYYIGQGYLESIRKREERHVEKGNGFRYTLLSLDGYGRPLVCGGSGHEMNLIKDVVLENCWKGGDKKRQKNEEGIRNLTEREWARMQGFPEWFTFPVPKTNAYKAIANSVTVPLVREIAMQIKKSLLVKKEALTLLSFVN